MQFRQRCELQIAGTTSSIWSWTFKGAVPSSQDILCSLRCYGSNDSFVFHCFTLYVVIYWAMKCSQQWKRKECDLIACGTTFVQVSMVIGGACERHLNELECNYCRLLRASGLTRFQTIHLAGKMNNYYSCSTVTIQRKNVVCSRSCEDSMVQSEIKPLSLQR